MKELSARTVERAIQRGFRFLSGVSHNSSIRRILVFRSGYNTEEHQKGWDLLLRLMGYGAPFQPPEADTAIQESAISELDQWDGPAFTRARAALEYRFPDQSSYLFAGIRAQTGPSAIGSVLTFLDRVKALREGSDPARAAHRETDKQAAAILEQRRIVDKDKEAHLRGLLTQAQTLPPVEEELPPDPGFANTAVAFHAWLTDWREQARVLISRRDQLIQLGLASRRSSPPPSDEEPPDGDDAPAFL